MSPRRISLVLIVALLGFAAWWFRSNFEAPADGAQGRTITRTTVLPGPPPTGSPATASSLSASASAVRPAASVASPAAALRPVTPELLAADFPVVAPLNAPRSTITGDLETLRNVLETWRTNFPREGNPVGENAEITAALTGENRLAFALIPKNHPAINARGELCDRWGTPFRFHQISGELMELRSAGPDRKFGTPDDALLPPAAP